MSSHWTVLKVANTFSQGCITHNTSFTKSKLPHTQQCKSNFYLSTFVYDNKQQVFLSVSHFPRYEKSKTLTVLAKSFFHSECSFDFAFFNFSRPFKVTEGNVLHLGPFNSKVNAELEEWNASDTQSDRWRLMFITTSLAQTGVCSHWYSHFSSKGVVMR